MHSNELWSFTDLVPRRRRERLSQSVAFEEIADAIAKQSVVVRPALRSLRDGPPGYRRPQFRILIHAKPAIVDLFHNGIDGYRARYLQSVDDGEVANRLMIRVLTPRLIEAWNRRQRRPVAEDWIAASLMSGAKVWIHQGHWARLPDHVGMKLELRVPVWIRHENNPDRKVRRKVKLGALCPEEREIEVKGGFLDASGHPLPASPKSLDRRSSQIHDFGFT